MARIVILGGGISGHTAAMHLRRKLSKSEHEVIVVTPNKNWNWIPSNIWVGTGKMDKSKVVFPLAPIYKRMGVTYRQAKATTIYPEGTESDSRPQVEIEFTDPKMAGEVAKIPYDFLINCTGPKLNFGATEGLGPDGGYTYSVCTADHAEQSGQVLQSLIKELKAGAKKRIVVGTGHGTCTCQGAAFEYCFNVDYDLREAGVRDNVELVYLTNEAKLGDFGVDGMTFRDNGYATNSQLWTESLFRERGVKSISGAAVQQIREGQLTYENLNGEMHDLDFDFAMLLPPFSGVGLKAKLPDGTDITDKVFAPNGFMRVDADYTPKPYEEWRATDWPETYQSPAYPNMFAAGIAFAPPHAISKPRKTPNGTMIAPAPPRTGMPSGTIGKEVAMSIVDLLKDPNAKLHKASMGELGAACVASTGTGFTKGTAAAMVMYPIIPDETVFADGGRNPRFTFGSIGLFGHWTKYLLHIGFIYKAKARPFWWLIPE
ncbi:NAD(P)/FAD-dependent oxidoreductase [Boudabousia marimammalium]|uniref:Sulfide:quinone reductase n=1 Tax=Boudabousia marimammalium TaxID=156892 RepID=A0A1Q5PSC3_9ACTO|nr:FAD/NAD(P)-binding oxidoreductase [Boudabousia marimammalium]OKL50433.1 sulfide:quinone reductase [Boudabousia marimammalium]